MQPALARAEPRFFGPASRPLFGWLHASAPAEPRHALGLVLCNPFGNEALCAHRTMRHFAEAAAELGVPALRFDYDGAGDSAGTDHDPGRWAAWRSSVHHAVDELRRATGVERVCLLGVRLGATLASLAAGERDDIAGLIAVAPVISGKRWLRELSALQIALGHGEPPPGTPVMAGDTECVGFVLTTETRAALETVDLVSEEKRPASDVLLLDRHDLASNTRWVERLEALGSRVDHRQVPGYAELMLDAHNTVVPAQMVSAISTWLAAAAASSHEPAARLTSAPPLPASSAIMAPGLEETACFLDRSRTLFGIVSAPSGVPRPTRAILLLNSGAIHHVGPNRLYVQFARRWATRGYVVLRFDVAGVGDSTPWPGEPENVVYSPHAVRDLGAALTFLRDRWGAISCRATGMCSGAYHAFKGAVAGFPLIGVTIVNPLVFFWKPGMSLEYPGYKLSQAAADYRKSLRQIDKWKKFLSGGVNVWALAQVMALRAATLAARAVRDVARAMGRPLADDLGVELEAIAGRDIALRFVFSAGDPGEDLLRIQAGSSLRRLLRADRLRIQRIEGPDHTFTPVWSHAALTSVLDEELGVR